MVDAAETFCFVVYDVVDDRIRQRFSEACLDYGLERFQMSAFSGRITPSQRKELFLRLVELLGESSGRILVQPVCSEDLKRQGLLHQGTQPNQPAEGNPPARVSRDFPEPGRDKPTIIKL
jgi:CRISPR-associated protein Cas2